MHSWDSCVKMCGFHSDIVHQVNQHITDSLMCELCSCSWYVSYNEKTSKGESGFLLVKCNKPKSGKSALQPGILFVCIKLAFLIYLSPAISDCISILMMYKWKIFSVKSHGNLHKITLMFFLLFFPAVILEGCTFLLLKWLVL